MTTPDTTMFAAVYNSLQWFAANGVKTLDLAPETLEIFERWEREHSGRSGKKEGLGRIQIGLGRCTRCELHRQRKKIVFGAGNPRARLVFVGEGPGAEEDRKGEPFVGAAGQLLTKIIAAIKMTRQEVYICNVVKCRPPQNRTPLKMEIETCYPFLKRQLAAVDPDFICALGKTAAQTLLGSAKPLAQLRGRFWDYGRAQLIVTYHPAALLYDTSLKRDTWEDMKKLMARMQPPQSARAIC